MQTKVNTELRMFNSSVKLEVLFSSETWGMTQIALKRILTFINRYLHSIMNLKLSENISNDTLCGRTKQWRKKSRRKVDVDFTKKTPIRYYQTSINMELRREEENENGLGTPGGDILKQKQRRSVTTGTKITKMAETNGDLLSMAYAT